MQNAAIDTNSKQSIIARLKTDGVTNIRAIADPNTGALSVTGDRSSTVIPSSSAGIDENGRSGWFAVSENDPTQLVAIQCDSQGKILVKMI